MYNARQKMLACAVCAALFFAALFSILIIAEEANHTCTGEDCPICALVSEAENTLEKLGTGHPQANPAGFLPFVFVVPILSLRNCGVSRKSPVAEKVRLND